MNFHCSVFNVLRNLCSLFTCSAMYDIMYFNCSVLNVLNNECSNVLGNECSQVIVQFITNCIFTAINSNKYLTDFMSPGILLQNSYPLQPPKFK